MRNTYTVLAEKPQLGRQRYIYERIKLRECGLNSFVSRWGTIVGSCEHSNERSVSIQNGGIS
jgi:hypothetical protein